MCNHLQHAGSNYPSWSSVIGTQIPHGVGAAFAGWARIASGSIVGPWLLHGGLNFGVTIYVLLGT